MKKITFVLFCALMSMFASVASAAVISLNPGDNVATTLAAASDGDIIELSAEGNYVWGVQVTINTPKSFTIRAAAGLASRPVMQAATAMNFGFVYAQLGTASGTMKFDGVTFDGMGHTPIGIVVKCSTGYNVDVEVNNCMFKNLLSFPGVTPLTNVSAVLYSNSATNLNPNGLTFTNSVFTYDGYGVFNANGNGRPKNVTFTNCYFKGKFNRTIANSSASTGLVDLYLIDHCTFDSNDKIDVSLWGNVDLKNCIFANSTSTGSGSTANAFGTGGNLMTKCGLFYAGAANKAFPDAILDASTLRTDPKINEFGFATAAEYKTPGGTDSKPIGFYESAGVTVENLVLGISSTKMDNASLKVIQNGNSFKVNASTDAAYTVYSISGMKVSEGVFSNGTMQLNAAKGGVYFLKSNGKVAKFAIK